MSAADTVERISREAIEQTGLSRVDLAWVFAAVSRGYKAGFADCRETAMRAARELAATLVSDVLASGPARRFAGNPLPVARIDEDFAPRPHHAEERDYGTEELLRNEREGGSK